MVLDLNIDPYFDNFDSSKNFLRILSNPGRAVQSRELTQAQTILQNQLSSMGNNLFKEGTSIINARIKVNFNKQFFIVDVLDDTSTPVDVNDFLNRNILGNTSGATATVTNIDATTRSLYYEVLSGSFTDGEKIINSGGTALNATMTSGSEGEAIISNIEPGIVYVGGAFIVVPQQEKIVNGSVNTGEYIIGYNFTEDIITSDTDTTLLDPANGSFNFNAPGADRYRGRALIASYQVSVDTPPTNFIEVIRILDGKLISEQDDVQFNVILDLLASRTFDTNGNYTINEFAMKIDNHDTDATKVKVELEPGKAFVLGYEHETIATTEISVDRARSFDTVQNLGNFIDFGPYIDIATDTGNPDVEGMFDISTKEEVDLYTEVDGSAGTGVVIGRARITAIIATATGLRAYFSQANTLTSIFTSVRSFESVANAGVYANVAIDATTSLPVLGNKGLNTAIFKLRDDNIKETRDLNYFSLKSFTGLVNVADDYTVNAPSTTTDFLSSDGVVYVIDGVTGLLIPSTSWSYVINNLTAPGISTLTVTVVGGPATIDVLVVLDNPIASPLAKVLTEVTTTFTLGVSVTSKTLSQEDIFEVTSVRKDPTGADVDLLSQAVLDNGARDYYYDVGVLSNLDDNIDYEITYKYFVHSGTGEFFSVDSYINATNLGFYSDIYDRIENYTSQDGGSSFELRDSIDFRRKLSDLSSGTLMVQPGTTLRLDYDYYLPRTDKVYIDQYGDFGSITGIPAIIPEDPNDLENAMTLYNIELPAYTFNPSDIKITIIDNKNFTMKDIGKLERRVENLEYYSALSLLEQDATNLSITDSNGFDRFKNGIVVDDFSGHGVGNVFDENYNCSIDQEEGILRSPFDVEIVDLQVKAGATNIAEHPHTITLSYSTSVLIDQPNASTIINVNPFNVFKWVGRINLTPKTDNWFDTARKPDVIVNVNGTNDNIGNISRSNWLGTRWNSWQTVWNGLRGRLANGKWGFISSRVLNQSLSDLRRQKRTRAIPGRITKKLGDRVIDNSLVPWMRAKTITWTAVGMKPTVALKATFDGVDVTALCTGLTTDGVGSATGTFALPNTNALKFRSGTKVFRLADDLVNPTTSAEVSYTSTGVIETKQKTILAVDPAQRVQQDIKIGSSVTNLLRRFNNARTRWEDPIAQSFLINNQGGIFLSDIELFFQTKDSNLPVTVYIVENENGIPTQNIVPYSEVTLNPASVNTSTDGSVGTTFTFSDPVYLQDGTEYSFVVISNTDSYNVFISSLGGTDLISGNIISKQPFTGVFFKSQNASTWTPDQNKDIKFKMNRCVFITADVGTIELHNELPAADIDLTTMAVSVDDLAINNTNISWSYKFGTNSYANFEMKENISLAVQQTLSNLDIAPRSLTTKAILSTQSDAITPLINKGRASIITVLNEVNIATQDAGQYSTRFITLENPSDDLRVIFDSKQPSGTSVDVFFRTGQFVPRYVEISDAVYSSWVGNTQYVYHWDGAAITLKGSFVTTKIDGINLYIFMKEISNIGAFLAPTDWAGAGLDATKGVITINDGTISVIEEWDAADPAFSTGDYVFYSNLVYKAKNGPTPTGGGNEPDVATGFWDVVQSSIVDNPTAGQITGTAVIETAEQSWRSMVLETGISAAVNTVDNFVEYSYVPEDPIDEEFSSFSIKLELKSNTTVNVPEVKDFRALAVY